MSKRYTLCRCCGEWLREAERESGYCENCEQEITRKIALDYLQGYQNFWREARGKVDDYLKKH